MPIGNTYVTDARHFLDEDGELPPMPGPALNLALFLGSIIGWVTSLDVRAPSRTNVPCRRMPQRRRCPGEIEAGLEADGATIAWGCPACGDNGIINGWEGTRWDRRGAPAPPEPTRPANAPKGPRARKRRPRKTADPTPGTATVLQFRVELQEVKPAVWRRIQVPAHYTFWDLHVAIQDAMGWTDTHLHQFVVHHPATGRRESIGIPDEDWPEERPITPGWETPIAAYFSTPGTVAEYVYDFGDDWHHSVRFEGVGATERGVHYPHCLDGARACPPEDVGGPHGYDQFRAAIADPDHAEHDAMLQWVGGAFDPTRFAAAAVQFDDPRLRWRLAFEP